MFPRFICVVACILLLNNILVVSHFISPVDSFINWWTFKCLCFLTIMNNAKVNTYTSFLRTYSWAYAFWVELLGHVIAVYWPALGTAKLFSKWLYQFLFLPTIHEDSSYLPLSVALVTACLCSFPAMEHFCCAYLTLLLKQQVLNTVTSHIALLGGSKVNTAFIISRDIFSSNFLKNKLHTFWESARCGIPDRCKFQLSSKYETEVIYKI